MTLHVRYVGCDISKDTLDFYDPALGKGRRVRNTPASAAHWAASLDGAPVLVVMEATGVYDRVLRTALQEAGVAYARINPLRARRYAQAAGFLAKTDAVDARMLASMGEALKLASDAPPDPAREALCALQKRRDQLVGMRAEERNRRCDVEGALAASIDEHIAWLSDEIRALDDEIKVLVTTAEPLREDVARLRSVPGVGPVAASVLLAYMPELGQLSPKKIASLAGLAPVNNDSGIKRGERRIRGGRGRVRRALYMAALSAIRTEPRFTHFYQRIVERAQAKKVAIIAVARKLLTILNAIIRDKTRYA